MYKKLRFLFSGYNFYEDKQQLRYAQGSKVNGKLLNSAEEVIFDDTL